MCRRVLLKVSGEALRGLDAASSRTILREPTELLARQIKDVHGSGIQVAVLVGAGNIIRGSEMKRGFDLDRSEEVEADLMGMAATLVNAGALSIMLKRCGIEPRVMSAIECRSVAEPWLRKRAIRHLEKGRVIVLAGGTGNPRFTTDTAAVLRAVEIGADMMLKGTKVAGIYDRDPVLFPDAAKLINRLTYGEFLNHFVREQPLGVIDTTAVTTAANERMPVRVFSIFRPGSFIQVLHNEGTYSEISS